MEYMKFRHAIFAFGILTFGALSLALFVQFLWKPFGIPRYAALRAHERISQLQPGMTETQVWETLGLSQYDTLKYIMGSGPPDRFPANYKLWNGYILHCKWNTCSNSMVLVEARFN